jgi:hypothetical protein
MKLPILCWLFCENVGFLKLFKNTIRRGSFILKNSQKTTIQISEEKNRASRKLINHQSNKAPKKGTKRKDPKSKQNEEITKGVDRKGNINKSCTQTTPPLRFIRNISNNEKEGTLEKTCSLEEPLLIVTTHFKIEFACAHCNGHLLHVK